ncbi:MAG: adenylate kinase family protein [Nanobdellota archaeon]
MVVICVTGTPCVGKTTFAKELSSHLDYVYFDVGAFIKEKGLSEGFDNAHQCDIVDEDILVGALKTELTNMAGVILDSHMSHLLPKDLVDLCIVLKAPLKTLKSRLEARGYSPEKVRENLDAEIFDLCHIEAVEAGHTVLVLDEAGLAGIKKVEGILSR